MPHFIRLKIKAYRDDVTQNDIINRREDIVNLIKSGNTISLTAIAKAIGVTLLIFPQQPFPNRQDFYRASLTFDGVFFIEGDKEIATKLAVTIE